MDNLGKGADLGDHSFLSADFFGFVFENPRLARSRHKTSVGKLKGKIGESIECPRKRVKDFIACITEDYTIT